MGDRLDTDIAGARAAGLASAWVLTGVDQPSDLLSTELHPTYVIASLSELLRPYAVPQALEGTWQCASATARIDGGLLHLEPGDAQPIEAVRAGLAALLERRDSAARSDADTALLRAGGEMLDRALAARAEDRPPKGIDR